MNVPWTQFEKVELLTEIIKAVGAPPEALLPVIASLRIQPPWMDMALPRGRTVRQSQEVFNSMMQPNAPIGLTRSSSVSQVARPMDVQAHRSSETTSAKRPYSMEGPSSGPSTGNRFLDIQPKPAGFENLLNPPSPGEPPKKKRGRPSKAESIRREAVRSLEAQAYGPRAIGPETSAIPGPSTVLPPGLSAAQMQALQAARSVMTPPPLIGAKRAATETHETSSEKKRRGRPPRLEPESLQVALGEAPKSASVDTPPLRAYPDILSRDPREQGQPSFRAPRGQGE